MDKWDKRFMELTETVAGWSSCFQENRHVGAGDRSGQTSIDDGL